MGNQEYLEIKEKLDELIMKLVEQAQKNPSDASALYLLCGSLVECNRNITGLFFHWPPLDEA